MSELPSPGYDHFQPIDPANPPPDGTWFRYCRRTPHGIDVWLDSRFEPRRMGGPATHWTKP